MLNIHENIKSKLNNFIEYKKIPNIIFHGVSGSGKKTILFDCIKFNLLILQILITSVFDFKNMKMS